MEFDPATAPMELTMFRYFEKGLKPSITAEMDEVATHLDNYKELVAKAVRAKAKAGLQPSSYMQEVNLQVLRESWPTHTIVHKVQTQEAMTCGDNSKPFKSPTSTLAQDSDPSDKARKHKKRKHYRDKRDSRELKDSSTLASGINKAKVGGKGQRKKNKKDISGVTCFNCNKKGHFSNKCPEPPKN